MLIEDVKPPLGFQGLQNYDLSDCDVGNNNKFESLIVEISNILGNKTLEFENNEKINEDPVRDANAAHRIILYAFYGILGYGLWGLLIGRAFQEFFSFTLIFNIIAGAIIGAIIGVFKKMKGAILIGYGLMHLWWLIEILISENPQKGLARAFIFGPVVGFFIGLLIKYLYDKGVFSPS